MAEEVSFGGWLRRQRKALDLTQAELAERVGCAEGSIRHLEANEQRPSKQLAERLAAALGVEPEARAGFVAFARGGPAIALPAQPLAPERRADHALPSGTVTFLFTDIEGSTKRWEQHPQAMPQALAQHNALMSAAVEAHGGVVFKLVGDAFCAAFARATDALAAALNAQRALQTAVWGPTGPLLIRMALHTGVVVVTGDDYQGLALSRIARLLSAGHGGQILLSRATHELVREHLPPDVDLRDLGEHQLKDLTHPEQIYQLVVPDLPTDFPHSRP